MTAFAWVLIVLWAGALSVFAKRWYARRKLFGQAPKHRTTSYVPLPCVRVIARPWDWERDGT